MNILLWGVLWSIVGWLTGVLVYFTAGLFTLPSDNHHLRNKAANYYSDQAMKLLGRAALVERGTKYDIYSTTHDSDTNTDKIKIDGNTGHVSNQAGLLSTLHKKPFGLVPPPEEDIGVYVSPEIGELGRVETRRREQGALRDDNGNYNSDVDLGDQRPLVQLREHARRMVAGCHSLWDVDETIEIYQQSQSGFATPQRAEYFILIIAYCAAVLVMWIVGTNAGGAAPTGISVPGL